MAGMRGMLYLATLALFLRKHFIVSYIHYDR
mgnify:CR=1 FL=1